MTRSKRYILLIITVAAITAVVFFLRLILPAWHEPLAPKMELPSTATAIDPTNTITEQYHEQTTEITSLNTEQAATTSTNTLTPTPTPYCGGPQTMTVLALGIDTRADNYLYGLADVIKIVRVDFVTPRVTALSIPRDLWVQIPEISDHYGITAGKLNQAYFYGTKGMGYYDGPGGAPELLAKTLKLNFGINVDHYATVNMATFVKMVDAVGGIDIYLPYDVDGRPVDENTEDMGFFPAGYHHFSGDEALRFSRIRKVDTVFDRMDRQTMVLCALREKLLSPSVLPNIPKLISAFQNSLLTDLSIAQISQLACLLPKIPKENIIFTSLPEELLTPGRIYDPYSKNNTFIWEADYNIIRDYVAKFQSGIWPDQPDEPSCP